MARSIGVIENSRRTLILRSINGKKVQKNETGVEEVQKLIESWWSGPSHVIAGRLRGITRELTQLTRRQRPLSGPSLFIPHCSFLATGQGFFGKKALSGQRSCAEFPSYSAENQKNSAVAISHSTPRKPRIFVATDYAP